MLTVENLLESLNLFQQKIEKNKQFLSELDQAIGDGDHGNNMSRGMTAVMEGLQDKDPQTVPEIFKVAAMSLISKVGGASGPLYGTAMMEMAKASAKESDVKLIISSGLAGIKKRGSSDVGMKTMIDLWSPTIDALAAGNLTTADLASFASATKDMEAKKGRASYLGERSIGHIDPGAVSSQYLFESFVEAGVFHE